MGSEADGNGAVNVGQFRVMIRLLACKSHFSDEADGLREASEPVGLADRGGGKLPTRQPGQGVLYLGFVKSSAHKDWKVFEGDSYPIGCFFQQRATRGRHAAER